HRALSEHKTLSISWSHYQFPDKDAIATSRIRHFSLYLCTVLHGTEFLTLRIVMSVGGQLAH
ncbi:hypothetical protein QU967_24370, partial [Escherichia coli]|nr:hypothetical protein [Escherichia coli]